MSYAGKKPLAVTARREKVPGAVVSHGSSLFQEGSQKWLWLPRCLSVSAAPRLVFVAMMLPTTA